MAWIGNYVYNTIFGTNAIDGIDGYEPSIRDVLTVKEALQKKSTLPYELVDAIVDMAEYWPHTSTFTSQPLIVRAGRRDENKLILRSYPLGYIPPINDSEGEDLSLKDEKAYQTLKPKPCQESRIVPDELTKDLLSKWTSRSLTKGEHACRKIVFSFKSRDQGWGGQPGQEGTYDGSFTWFEAGLERMIACRRASIADNPDVPPDLQFEISDVQPNSLSSSPASSEPLTCHLQTSLPSIAVERDNWTPDRFHHDLLPSTKLTIQKNVVATLTPKRHKVTWMSTDDVVADSILGDEIEKLGRGRDSANGEFVRNLKVGDVVTVWGKARFPGWTNFVQEVKIDVYWAI